MLAIGRDRQRSHRPAMTAQLRMHNTGRRDKQEWQQQQKSRQAFDPEYHGGFRDAEGMIIDDN
jgi:hypothetical protein